MPFPCWSEVILAPFLSSAQWVPQFLSCKPRRCQTPQWGEGLLVGLRFVHEPTGPSGTGSAQQGQRPAQSGPSEGGQDQISVPSLGARGEWPGRGVSRGPRGCCRSPDPGAGFSPASSRLQPSELTQRLFGERVSGRHLDGLTPPPALTRSFAPRPGAAASPLRASVSPSAEER